MHFSLLRLRSRQLKRQLEKPGILYGCLLLIALVAIVGGIWSQFNDVFRAKMVAAVIVATILSLHISRKDRLFVRNQLPSPQQQMFAEYSVLSLPLTLPCLFTHQWYLFPVMLLCFYGISKMSITLKQRTVFPSLSRLIPAADFELLSGFRKNYVLFILLYIAALATSWIIIAPVIILWVSTLTLLSCYQECEAYDMLTVSNDTSAGFLTKKIIRHYRLLAIASAPVLLINVIVHPAYFWVAVLLMIVQLILLILGITFKYSNYEPRRQLDTGNILLTIIAGSSLIPFLLPLPLLFAIKYYKEATANLKNYLHDQHP